MSTDESESDHGTGERRTDTAFVALLTGHQLFLRNFVSSLVPAVDIRADIVQEVNILLWEKRSNFELGTNFKAWAFAVARYVIMNNQKRFRREGRLVFSSDLVEVLADQFEEMAPEPDERMEALRDCLGRLRLEHQSMLLACHEEHGSIERVAERRGQPAVTIRSILLRLRGKLRKCVYEQMARTRLAS
jgi:RNA polymerase sigma-70 factor (ECF subfamily)